MSGCHFCDGEEKGEHEPGCTRRRAEKLHPMVKVYEALNASAFAMDSMGAALREMAELVELTSLREYVTDIPPGETEAIGDMTDGSVGGIEDAVWFKCDECGKVSQHRHCQQCGG
jgi:hypothetical protein